MTTDWVPVARLLHACGTGIGTLLLVVLIFCLAGSGLWHRHPAFFFYLWAAFARVIQWAWGVSDTVYLWSEGAAMTLKALTILEAFVALFPRRRVPTLGMLLLLAGVLAGITTLLPKEPNAVREFERWRQAAHIGLATFTTAGCAWLWCWPRPVSPYTLRYWRIWTFRLACMAAAGFINYPSAQAGGMQWIGYYALAWSYLLSWWVATVLWIRWVRESTVR